MLPLSPVLSPPESVTVQRQDHESAASQLFEQARLQAEAGQINEAGSLILKALSHERRAGSVGPQVMQLIKPRA